MMPPGHLRTSPDICGHRWTSASNAWSVCLRWVGGALDVSQALVGGGCPRSRRVRMANLRSVISSSRARSCHRARTRDQGHRVRARPPRRERECFESDQERRPRAVPSRARTRGSRFVRDRTRSDERGLTFVVTVVRDVGVDADSGLLISIAGHTRPRPRDVPHSCCAGRGRSRCRRRAHPAWAPHAVECDRRA